MKKIMIVEDDISIRNELKELLDNSGYEGIALDDFKNAKAEIVKSKSDLILLDINLPFMNGELLIKELRKEMDTPIIMVTSKNNEVDEVLSMSWGADDYITKPYNPTILLLRIGSILKRMDNNTHLLNYKDLKVHIERGFIEREKKQVLLTKNEMIIFSYLLSHQSQLVTRDDLMTALWNNKEYINDNALTVNMSRLRNKLKEVGYENVIETRKGYGYILV